VDQLAMEVQEVLILAVEEEEVEIHLYQLEEQGDQVKSSLDTPTHLQTLHQSLMELKQALQDLLYTRLLHQAQLHSRNKQCRIYLAVC